MTSSFDLHRRFTVTNPFKLGHAFERPRQTGPVRERKLLSKYTGRHVTEREANYLWPRIADHKWYLSERLSRDVGFHVAAVDYVENFYQPIAGEPSENKMTPYIKTMKRRANNALRFYFESKGETPVF
jgi:hypothetical protein